MRICQELDKFKSNILQRSAARDMALKQATQCPGYYADLSYQHNPSTGSVILNGPMNQSQLSFSQGQPLHPQPQQQPQQPHYPPPNISQSHNFPGSSFHDPPVLHKDIRYSTTSSRSRDLSVFDPLQPIPPQPLVAGGSITMQQLTQSPRLQPQFHEQDQMHMQQQQQQDQIHSQQQIQMQHAPHPPPAAQQHHLQQQQLPAQIQHQHQQSQRQIQRDSPLGLSLPPPTVHQHHPLPTSFPSSPNPVRKYTPNSPSTTQQMQLQNNLQSGHLQPQVIQSLSNQSMAAAQSMDTNKTRSSSANSQTYIGSNGQQPPQQSQTTLLPHSSSHQRLQQLQQPPPSQPSQPPSQQPQQSAEQQQPPSSQQSQQSSQLQQQSTVPGKKPTSITSQPTTPLEEKRLSAGQMYLLNNPPRSIPSQMGLTSLPHVSSIDQSPSTSQAHQQQLLQPNSSSASPGARPVLPQQVTSYFNPQAPSEALQPRTSSTTSYNANMPGAVINGNSSSTQISSLVSGTVSNGNQQQQQQTGNGSLPPPPPTTSHQLQGASFQSQPTSNNTVYSLLNPNNEASSSAVSSAVSPSTKRVLEENETSRPSATSAAHSTSPVSATGSYHQELKRTRLV